MHPHPRTMRERYIYETNLCVCGSGDNSYDPQEKSIPQAQKLNRIKKNNGENIYPKEHKLLVHCPFRRGNIYDQQDLTIHHNHN